MESNTTKIMAMVRKEKSAFLLSCLCLICWLIFFKFCTEVVEGESHDIDQQIIFYIRDHILPNKLLGQPWFAEMMRDLTGLGGIGVLSFITIATAIYFLILKKRGHAFYIVLAVGSGTIFSNMLKTGFDRPRPNILPHGSNTYLPGFPSGHAMLSAIVYLTLGAMLAAAHTGRAMRIYLMGVAITLSLLIGISRIYLGVHWPSDVLAGWLGGAAWAMMVWIVYQHAERRFQTKLHNYKSL